MAHTTELFGYSRYLLITAHPDDEVHCGALVSRLVTGGKRVKMAVLTNGDAGANAAGRVGELKSSVKAMGLDGTDLVLLGISETGLLASAKPAFGRLSQEADAYSPDCILSLDYEGGHEGHDLASYLAHKIARERSLPQFVFPDYHFRNGRRYGLEFLPGREVDVTLELSDEEKDLKIKLLEAHRGQLGFYLRLQKNQDNYFSLLFKREVYRKFPEGFDYLEQPDYQIGYEFHRNGFKFKDFARAIGPLE